MILLGTVFLLGMSVGSFLNMCAYRMPRELSLSYSRSRCSRCGFIIPWYDNIPIVSCLLLFAKCRRCSVPFSWSHLLIELGMGLVAVLIFKNHGIQLLSVFEFLLISTLVLISLIDFEFRIIPDELSLGGLAAGLLLAGLAQLAGFHWFIDFYSALLGAVLGAASLWIVGKVYELVSGKEGMGLGDVKLIAMMGAFIGPAGLFTVIFLSSLLGSAYGIFLILLRRMHARAPIPFGPFLCLGFIVEMFFKKELVSVCKICIPLIL